MTADNHRALVLLSALAFLWNLSARIEPQHNIDQTPEARWANDFVGPNTSASWNLPRMAALARQQGGENRRSFPAANHGGAWPGDPATAHGERMRPLVPPIASKKDNGDRR